MRAAPELLPLSAPVGVGHQHVITHLSLLMLPLLVSPCSGSAPSSARWTSVPESPPALTESISPITEIQTERHSNDWRVSRPGDRWPTARGSSSSSLREEENPQLDPCDHGNFAAIVTTVGRALIWSVHSRARHSPGLDSQAQPSACDPATVN